jgi:hypothetical protein
MPFRLLLHPETPRERTEQSAYFQIHISLAQGESPAWGLSMLVEAGIDPAEIYKKAAQDALTLMRRQSPTLEEALAELSR